jgi:hypothetical protein
MVMTLFRGAIVVETDRRDHRGRVIDICPGDGDCLVAFDTEPVGTHWELEGFLMEVAS